MGAHLSAPKTDKVSTFGGDFKLHTTQYGSSSMQGWRITMEDAHLTIPDISVNGGNANIALYGVFDGHGGTCVSHWTAENFSDLFKYELSLCGDKVKSGEIKLKSQDMINEEQGIIAEALQSTFLRVDEELMKTETDAKLRIITDRLRTSSNGSINIHDSTNLFRVLMPERNYNKPSLKPLEQHSERIFQENISVYDTNTSEDDDIDEAISTDEYSDQLEDGGLAYGCGAASIVVAVVNGANPCLIVANAGDSRAILCRGGKALALSHDHKPHLPEEGERIRRAGGSVTNGRVDGNLNLSRSIGDLAFKSDSTLPPQDQKISAFPDVCICPLTKKDQFVVIACDGIWDCKTNQEVVDFIQERLEGNNSANKLSKICEELCDACLSNNPSESDGIGCDNMTCIIVQLNHTLIEKSNSSSKITLYGKDRDPYIAADEF